MHNKYSSNIAFEQFSLIKAELEGTSMQTKPLKIVLFDIKSMFNVEPYLNY